MTEVCGINFEAVSLAIVLILPFYTALRLQRDLRFRSFMVARDRDCPVEAEALAAE